MRDLVSLLRFTQSKWQGRITSEMYSEPFIKRELKWREQEGRKSGT